MRSMYPGPAHRLITRRPQLVRLTEPGQARYQAIDQKQAAWANQLAAGLTRADLETTARVLGELCTRLEADPTQPHHQEGNDHEP